MKCGPTRALNQDQVSSMREYGVHSGGSKLQKMSICSLVTLERSTCKTNQVPSMREYTLGGVEGGGGGVKLEKILYRTTCSPEFQ